MTIGDTVQLAFRNLGQAKLRTALTMLGVAIGIASLAGMVSLGVGLEDQIVGRFTQSGVFDSVTVLPQSMRIGPGARRGGRLGGRGGRAAAAPDGASESSPASQAPALDDAAIAQLERVEHVREVYPNIRVPLLVTFGDAHELAVAIGVPRSMREQSTFQTMTAGGFLPDGESGACMVSLDFVKRLTDRDPASLVGQSLTLADPSSSDQPGFAAQAMGAFPVDDPNAPAPASETCRVSGVVERDAGMAIGGTPGVSGLMLPMARARDFQERASRTQRAIVGGLAPAGRGYASITVRVAGPEHTQDVEDAIKALNYNAFSINDALRGAKRAFLILDIVLSLIGSIALAVSSLGIVNTMVMSILERTREIGIMKAIGGSDGDIRRIFLVEASAIGVFGGAAGVAIGWFVGRVINFGANLYIQSQGGTPGNLFSLPFWLIGGAIGFSWVVSLLAGSYPAGRAARLDPIQALRHD